MDNRLRPPKRNRHSRTDLAGSIKYLQQLGDKYTASAKYEIIAFILFVIFRLFRAATARSGGFWHGLWGVLMYLAGGVALTLLLYTIGTWVYSVAVRAIDGRKFGTETPKDFADYEECKRGNSPEDISGFYE